MHACMCARTYEFMYIGVDRGMTHDVSMYVHKCVCLCTAVVMHVCIHICTLACI